MTNHAVILPHSSIDRACPPKTACTKASSNPIPPLSSPPVNSAKILPTTPPPQASLKIIKNAYPPSPSPQPPLASKAQAHASRSNPHTLPPTKAPSFPSPIPIPIPTKNQLSAPPEPTKEKKKTPLAHPQTAEPSRSIRDVDSTTRFERGRYSRLPVLFRSGGRRGEERR